MSKKRKRKEDDAYDSHNKLLKIERGETELARTRYDRAVIETKQEALKKASEEEMKKPEDEYFVSGLTREESEELARVLPHDRLNEFLALGAFIDQIRNMKPSERRKAVAELLKHWPPPMPDTAKIYAEGMKDERELLVELAKLMVEASKVMAPPQPVKREPQVPGKSSTGKEPITQPMVMTLSPNSGATSAGGSVKTVMSMFGGTEPSEFNIIGVPDRTIMAFVRDETPGKQQWVVEEATLIIPKSARSGTYNVTFEARGADKRSATAQYLLTVF